MADDAFEQLRAANPLRENPLPLPLTPLLERVDAPAIDRRFSQAKSRRGWRVTGAGHGIARTNPNRTSVAMMLWSVENRLGAEGLPVQAWATRADLRLRAHTEVRSATVLATYDDDELSLSGERLAVLSVAATVEAFDSDSAVALVEGAVNNALHDVIGDRDVGWTAYDWQATRLR